VTLNEPVVLSEPVRKMKFAEASGCPELKIALVPPWIISTRSTASSRHSKLLESKKDKLAEPVQGRAVDHGRKIRGIAAVVPEAGNVNVGARLTAGRFRKDPWRLLEEVGLTRGIRVRDLVKGERYDVEAGVQLLDARGWASQNDFVERSAGSDLRDQRSSLVGIGGTGAAPADQGVWQRRCSILI
jgi:hypothetical protein